HYEPPDRYSRARLSSRSFWAPSAPTWRGRGIRICAASSRLTSIAQLETAMWRDYYEKRYPALFYHLYELSRTQFGFSPLDSLRIALSAAKAASSDDPAMTASGIARAEAMAYRDARREAVAAGDWGDIEREVVRA